MHKIFNYFTLIYYIDAIHKHILKLPKSSLDWGKIISATVFSARCAGVAAERLQTDAILSIVTVMWEIFSDLNKNIVDMGDWVSVIIIHVLVNFKSLSGQLFVSASFLMLCCLGQGFEIKTPGVLKMDFLIRAKFIPSETQSI